LAPGQLAARILLGHVYLQLKNPVAAADQFEAALLVDAKNTEAKAGLAQSRAANH
jgi:Tfp pilus assembly protein PilF